MAAGAVIGGRLRWAGPELGFRPANEPPDLHVIDSWVVSDGRVRGLGMHAERFGVACFELFAVPRAHTVTFLCAAITRIPSHGRWFPRVELVVQGGEPHFQLWIRPAPPRGKTVRLWISDEPDRRHRPTVKGADLDYLLGLRRLAVAEGADEALILSREGQIREGSTTSILWWRGDTLYAPPLSADLLAGVTRELLLASVAARGLRVATESPAPAELDGLEVWTVNALHGIRPVTGWIGASIEAGPATRAARWNAYLDGLAVPRPLTDPHGATSSRLLSKGIKPMPTQPVRHKPPSFERDLLAQLSSRWGKRVAVKKDELDLDGHFDPELPDFPDQLVPVLDLPEANSVDLERRNRILSAAWIAYNAKTAAIENEIILPACRLMLEERIPMRRDQAAVSALHQTIIDEHYHILMCHNAVGVTRRRRELTDLTFDPAGWSVVGGLNACRAGLIGSERDLVEIAFALAAETTIGSFLSMISTAFDIQPMNRITVDMHRKDESGHAVVFRELVAPLYRELGHDDRELFKDALVQGLTAFRAPDFDPWVAVAETGGFDISAEQLAAVASEKTTPARDTGPLQLLLAELGIDSEFASPVGGSQTVPAHSSLSHRKANHSWSH